MDVTVYFCGTRQEHTEKAVGCTHSSSLFFTSVVFFLRMLLHKESVPLKLSPGVTASPYLPPLQLSASSKKVAPVDGSAAGKKKTTLFSR